MPLQQLRQEAQALMADIGASAAMQLQQHGVPIMVQGPNGQQQLHYIPLSALGGTSQQQLPAWPMVMPHQLAAAALLLLSASLLLEELPPHRVSSACSIAGQDGAPEGLQRSCELRCWYGVQVSGLMSGSPGPASALMGPVLAPPSPQALSGMNPSQMILSQPSGAGLQALQMPSQPDVQSAPPLLDASGTGVKKPQVRSSGLAVEAHATALGASLILYGLPACASDCQTDDSPCAGDTCTAAAGSCIGRRGLSIRLQPGSRGGVSGSRPQHLRRWCYQCSVQVGSVPCLPVGPCIVFHKCKHSLHS